MYFAIAIRTVYRAVLFEAAVVFFSDIVLVTTLPAVAHHYRYTGLDLIVVSVRPQGLHMTLMRDHG